MPGALVRVSQHWLPALPAKQSTQVQAASTVWQGPAQVGFGTHWPCALQHRPASAQETQAPFLIVVHGALRATHCPWPLQHWPSCAQGVQIVPEQAVQAGQPGALSPVSATHASLLVLEGMQQVLKPSQRGVCTPF